MTDKQTPEAFDTAYPGSMSPKRDGTYIRRDDNGSLAAALLENIAALKDQRDELLEALNGLEVLYRRDGEGWNDCFERIAELFHAETGYLRPGKDCRLHSDEERAEAWAKWINARIDRTRAAIEKATK